MQKNKKYLEQNNQNVFIVSYLNNNTLKSMN